MSKNRIYIKPEKIKEKTISIDGEDFHYLINVLRLKVSDIFYMFDGLGNEFRAKIKKVNKKYLKAEVVGAAPSGGCPCAPTMSVDIAQSLPKKDKMDLIVEKCTELGARSILPFVSERTIIKLNMEKEKKRIERWRKIAKSSSTQSRRNSIPQIMSLLSLKELKDKFDEYDLVVVPWEEEQKLTLKELFRDRHHERGCPQRGQPLKRVSVPILIVIGPEGGFSKEEINYLSHPKVKVVSLGKRILRTETVSMAVLSMINYEYEL